MSDSPGVNQRDHRKIVVVDGELAFAGGVNFSQAYRIASKQAGAAASRSKNHWSKDGATRTSRCAARPRGNSRVCFARLA